ncbi:hypothetical protein HAX54_036335 [Datura stramonium]|uniref:Uncharacterized protein n=1 Tax=Datura stramonium TaxID=4076 RepID=A0ABS8VHY8_DATST|nr:hypothetical protein [Datura stramonium]
MTPYWQSITRLTSRRLLHQPPTPDLQFQFVLLQGAILRLKVLQPLREIMRTSHEALSSRLALIDEQLHQLRGDSSMSDVASLQADLDETRVFMLEMQMHERQPVQVHIPLVDRTLSIASILDFIPQVVPIPPAQTQPMPPPSIPVTRASTTPE